MWKAIDRQTGEQGLIPKIVKRSQINISNFAVSKFTARLIGFRVQVSGVRPAVGLKSGQSDRKRNYE